VINLLLQQLLKNIKRNNALDLVKDQVKTELLKEKKKRANLTKGICIRFWKIVARNCISI
jgi:hypothetical protein